MSLVAHKCRRLTPVSVSMRPLGVLRLPLDGMLVRYPPVPVPVLNCSSIPICILGWIEKYSETKRCLTHAKNPTQ